MKTNPKRLECVLNTFLRLARSACVALFLMVYHVCAAESSPSCKPSNIETMGVEASKAKCGYPEFDCAISTPPKLYLIETEFKEGSFSSSSTSGGGLDGAGSYTLEIIRTYNRITCLSTPNYSGTADYWVGGTTNGGSIINSAPPEWSDTGSAAYGGASGATAGCLADIAEHCPENYTSTDECTYNSTGGGGDGDCVFDPGDGNTTTTVAHSLDITTLSDEYTDGMLRSDIMDLIEEEGYPSTWATGCDAASSTIDGSHSSGTLRKMKYRIKVPDTEKDVTYLVEWEEVTTGPGLASIWWTALG